MPRARKKKPGRTETLGDRIRRFRLAKGLTQTDLGKMVGVSQRVITYYEVRGVSPPPDLLVRIADALDVSLDELFGRKSPARRPAAAPVASLRRRRRLRRLEDLPRGDQAALLKMIDAMADRAGKRKPRG
ncbi:MAG: helix-turn-helix transcriptional regulator [Thermoanaerobaculia bacterium]